MGEGLSGERVPRQVSTGGDYRQSRAIRQDVLCGQAGRGSTSPEGWQANVGRVGTRSPLAAYEQTLADEKAVTG